MSPRPWAVEREGSVGGEEAWRAPWGGGVGVGLCRLEGRRWVEGEVWCQGSWCGGGT